MVKTGYIFSLFWVIISLRVAIIRNLMISPSGMLGMLFFTFSLFRIAPGSKSLKESVSAQEDISKEYFSPKNIFWIGYLWRRSE